MNEFISRSQAGQDTFAWIASGKKTDGTFLDIGSGHARERNNTFALEEMGWTGDLVDISVNAEMTAFMRKAKLHLVNAVSANWCDILGINPRWIDYLSLDVDDATWATLAGLPEHVRFGIITIEHDAYRLGNVPRESIRAYLNDRGYVRIASDIKDQNLEFEDWWVDEKYEANAAPFISQSKDWKEVVACK